MIISRGEDETWIYAKGLALSSTVDGGLRFVEGAVFRRLREFVEISDMEKSAYSDFLNFYTIADVRRISIAEGKRAEVAVTASLGNTINVLAVLKIEPNVRALADAFRLAVEAKAVAVANLRLKKFGRIVGGDVSDAVAVIATGGARERYVGLGTEIGDELFELVYKLVKFALWRSLRCSARDRRRKSYV